MQLSMTHHDSFHVKFYEPRERKLNGFSRLESLKNTLKEDSRVFLFR
jgi:hypothetical protein